MASLKIKKGDTVKVIAGKDKGAEGKVLSVDAKNRTRMVELFKRKLLLIFQTLCTFIREKLQELVSRWTETRKYVLPSQQVT